MSNHYFFGIKASTEVKKHLEEWQLLLSETMSYKNWTAPEDFHITIKFLGACSDVNIENYLNELQRDSWPPAFDLSVGPAGYFGSRIKPRVFHAEVEKHASLLTLKNQIDLAGKILGFEQEKREFSPHITLAKKQPEGTSPLLEGEFEKILSQKHVMRVDEVTLFRIHPARSPRYEALHKFML